MPLDGDRAFELTLDHRSRRSKSTRQPRDRDRRLGAGEAVSGGDGPARRARFADPGGRLPGHHLRGGGAGLLRLPLRRRASVRSKASLMEGNQQLAQLLSSQVQDRIDEVDARAVRGDRVGRHRRDRPPSSSICPPASSRWRARRGAEDPLDRTRRPIRRGAGASWTAGRATSRGWSGSRCSRGRPTSRATSATCTSCSRASRC